MLSRIAAAALALVLASCASTEGSGGGDSDPSGTNADKETTETTEAPKDETVRFGQPFEWEDNLVVKVSAPEKYELTDTGYIENEQADYLKFGIKIVNKTGKVFDPSMFVASLQSGNEEMEQVFDGSIGETPATKLLDGREVKFAVAFGAKDVNDLVMQVTPSFDYDAAIFTN